MESTLVQEAKTAFSSHYSYEGSIIVRAPGRVNLIGEHTDYNEGFVLPMALDMYTVIVGGLSSDQSVCSMTTTSQRIPDSERTFQYPISVAIPPPSKPGLWHNYVLGVIDQITKQCSTVKSRPAYNLLVHSNVPLGGGLSSSASLEVATLQFFLALYPGLIHDPAILNLKQQALLCQAAEHTYPQVPCGIMDQFICLMGQEAHALLINCRLPFDTRAVPLNDPSLVVLITDTQVKHALAGSEYGTRRAQCESAVAKLEKKSLRDVTLAELQAGRDKLSDVEYQRALHVVNEIHITTQAADALDKKDYVLFGKLMLVSHSSLRDQYQVSCIELDQLVELAMQCEGVFGSRMTGGGFGGCTVTLLKQEVLENVINHITKHYPSAKCYSTKPSAGASILFSVISK
ncbi:hypothetical protein LOD99_14389 [Oopsacas minuta]|uniref:Galactokinase n=1 Tax=Oopsacas minuta TaxID=111878 RepID=A0AAV7KFX7_9METZ|nr:hypothetical protein LOD99_14389 [Oopsacas minuta]